MDESSSSVEPGQVSTTILFMNALADLQSDTCPLPGTLRLVDRDAKVCFHEESEFAGRTRVISFVFPTDNEPVSILAFLFANRAFEDEAIGLDDAPFREALAILANLRFE
jgi:hypothetical protein